MVVKIGPEIEQFVFEICSCPEQRLIQILASKGAVLPFHERMGQGNVGDGLDFPHLQYPPIGLPLVEPIKRIVVGAEYFGNQACPRMARLNIRQSAAPSTFPAWTPKPMMRRVY
jgi:hypothetical protein